MLSLDLTYLFIIFYAVFIILTVVIFKLYQLNFNDNLIGQFIYNLEL